MNMLKIVQRFCNRTNLNAPVTVLGTTDSQIRQILALLEEEGNDLATRGDWQELTNEAILTTGYSGTTTFTFPSRLDDSTANFQSGQFAVGQTVTNNDTGLTTTISIILSSTSLGLNDDIFLAPGWGESYSIKTESQGAIKSIASNGFGYIKNQTIWDRDSSLPIYVINGSDWQQSKAINLSGPRYQARFRGGHLIANPIPITGLTWAFEYISENWITDLNGSNPDKFFNNDTDEVILPENLLLLGLRWRFLKEKGLEYAEQFATYEKSVANALSRNNMRRVISMSQRPSTPQPKVYVPEGDWSV